MPSQAPWRARCGGRCGARAALVLEALPPGSRGSRGGRGAPPAAREARGGRGTPTSRSRRPRSDLLGGPTAGRPLHGTRGGLSSAKGTPVSSRQFHGFGARSGGPLCKRCRRPEAHLDGSFHGRCRRSEPHLDTPFHGRCRVYKGEPRPPHGHGEQFCKRSRVLKGMPSLCKRYNACKVWYGCISGVSLRKQPLARGAQEVTIEDKRARESSPWRAEPRLGRWRPRVFVAKTRLVRLTPERKRPIDHHLRHGPFRVQSEHWGALARIGAR